MEEIMIKEEYIESLPVSLEAKVYLNDLFELGGFFRSDVEEMLNYIDSDRVYRGQAVFFKCSVDRCYINEHALGAAKDGGDVYFAREEFRKIISGLLSCEGFDED